MTNLLMLAYDYVDDLRKDLLYLEYLKLSKEKYELYSKEINELNEAKLKFDEVIKYGKNHPDFIKIANHYSNLSKEFYNIPIIKKELTIFLQLETKINNFIRKITNEISTNIPVLNELGFVSKKGGFVCGR